MTASLLQLVAIGSEDYYFIGNPQISYFKQINMRYTNFSIERMQLYNKATRKINIEENTQYVFKINTEYGDLLRSTYLHLKLPEIYSSEEYEFRWTRNIGSMIIEEARLLINDTIVEILDSHSINILNNLSLNKKSTEIYNNCICNIPDYYNPGDNDSYPYVSKEKYVSNNTIKSLQKINKNFSSSPSIRGLNLYIPLPFFHSRLKTINIPLCALRNSNVIIKIKLKPLRDLYTVTLKKTYDIGINSTFNSNYTKLLVNSRDQLIPYSYKKNNVSILDFIKDKNSLVDTNISLFNYVVFLDKAERYNFSNKKNSFLISVPNYYSFLGKSSEVDLKIENSGLVKEMYIFSQRSDVVETNDWSNYSLYDSYDEYFNRKIYQNHYLKLAIDQYNKDLYEFNIIKEEYQTLKNSLYTSGKVYEVLIRYIDNDNNNNSIFISNIDFSKKIDSTIEFYFDLLDGIIPDTHSFLKYYGLFRRNAADLQTEILQGQFRYKILNNKNTETLINSLKFLPLFTVNNLFIKIDFTNPRYTTSVLKNTNTFIRNHQALTDDNISQLLSIWKYRDLLKIPYIDDKNINYFDKSNIIESILIKADGNPINNIQDYRYASYGKLFEQYNNCNIKNILYYTFSEFPDKYQPSGHLNFKKINKLDVNLTLKDNLYDTLDYKFNVYIYLMVYKTLSIEKDSVSLL